jgi:hypothetical protein
VQQALDRLTVLVGLIRRRMSSAAAKLSQRDD